MTIDLDKLIFSTNLEPRPYQLRLISKAVQSYKEGVRSLMIESPTGSGKTACALLIAKAMQLQHPDLEIGWVSMRRNLLGQAQTENESKSINLRFHTISMFSSDLPKQLLEAPKRMIIIDECHHDATTSMVDIHTKVKADYIMGMSATGWRTDRLKLCFQKILRDAGLSSLIMDGYLSQYIHYTIPDWTVNNVINHYINDKDLFGRSIIYFHRIEQCQEAVTMLQNNGIAAEVVTATSDREDQIYRLESDKLKVLVNCMILSEGVDIPNLQTVFARPSCKSVTMQMAGRAFRKFPGIKYKNIVQCKHTKWPFVRSVAPAESYNWDGQRWLSLTPNNRINEINCKILVALAHINTKLPTYLTKKNMTKSGRSRRNRVINPD